jgi:hypothetical protein
MKKMALTFTLAFAITMGMAVVTVVADQAMAYTTIITGGDQASGGCGGAGC